MFIKYEDSYNPKIDFLLLKYLNPKYDVKKNYNELKDIFFKNEKPRSLQGRYFEKIKQIYEILIKEDLNINVISKCCKMFKINYDLEKVKRLIELNDNVNQEDITIKASEILLYLLNNKLFEKYNETIAFLIFNALLIKKKYIPFIMYHKDMHYLLERLSINLRVCDLHFYLKHYHNECNVFINKYPTLTKDELFKRLIESESIIFDDYDVEKMWVYGSFARDDANEYSDVDLYLELKEFDKEKVKQFKRFLESILLRRVDFHIEKYQKYTLYNNVREEREIVLDSNRRKGVIKNA